MTPTLAGKASFGSGTNPNEKQLELPLEDRNVPDPDGEALGL